MSEILEDTGKRVSGGHALLLCICHKCGSNFEIQRRRFSQLKPCLRCLRKKQKAYEPFYAKIEELEHKLEMAIEALGYYTQIDFQPNNNIAIETLEKLK